MSVINLSKGFLESLSLSHAESLKSSRSHPSLQLIRDRQPVSQSEQKMGVEKPRKIPRKIFVFIFVINYIFPFGFQMSPQFDDSNKSVMDLNLNKKYHLQEIEGIFTLRREYIMSDMQNDIQTTFYSFLCPPFHLLKAQIIQMQ